MEPMRQSRRDAARQVKNHAGGYVFEVDDIDRLGRFFCLGSESGTYYADSEQLTHENLQCVQRLIAAGRGDEVVRKTIEYSVNGRTAKQDTLMLVMAMCARQEIDPDTSKLCYEHLNEVCRIPTHLFTFLGYCEAASNGTGWGRAHRRAISNWYFRFRESSEQARRLAMLVTKYRNRNGWTHMDVIRLAHLKPEVNDNGVTAILKYIVKGFDDSKEDLANSGLLEYLQAVEDVRSQRDPNTVDVSGLAALIREHRLVREHVNTQLLKFPAIWEALLEHMPMTAMIRNLGKMASIGMTSPNSKYEKMIVTRLGDPEILKKARIHPFNILTALLTYNRGQGEVGKLTWQPNAAVVKALDAAFYYCFKLVEPTNKRFLLALDVSGSMFGCTVIGSQSITPGVAAAALSLVTANTERQFEIVGFSDELVPIRISPYMKLPDIQTEMGSICFGSTDCSLPMVYAESKRKDFDVFVVFTDNDTNSGRIKPAEAMKRYRVNRNLPNAKLIVCAMSSTGFTIADPDDPNMMDMCGFDSSGPEVMRNFIMGDM